MDLRRRPIAIATRPVAKRRAVEGSGTFATRKPKCLSSAFRVEGKPERPPDLIARLLLWVLPIEHVIHAISAVRRAAGSR